jgi:hypothetical protein
MLVSPSQSNSGETIDASDINNPVNQLAAAINGGLDNDNISSISGAKITSGTTPGLALDTTTRGGWLAGILAAPNTITNNGNRSYDLVFNSVDYTSVLSAGMRLRLQRTVTAPTQCADLESGSSQYFSKSSPSGAAQTDDITCMAWVKLESYTGVSQTIISRINGTTDGWTFEINSTGQLVLKGARAADDVITSYASVPLNRWVHVAASIDSSGGTGVTYIDGIAVSSVYTNNANSAFLTPTADLRVGGGTGGTLFLDGKIAQVALFSAVLTAATIRSYMSQGLAGTETSVVSAYSLSNSVTDLVTGNANNLSAQGSATTTNSDSPFSGGALIPTGVTAGTLDYAIVAANPTFSTNTTVTVQVPEGFTIPTSGGISAAAYALAGGVPFGFPQRSSKWRVDTLVRTNDTQATPTATTWYNLGPTTAVTGGQQITPPIGEWKVGYETNAYAARTGSAAGLGCHATLSTANNTEAFTDLTGKVYLAVNSAVDSGCMGSIKREKHFTHAAATTYYLNYRVGTVGAATTIASNQNSAGDTVIYADFGLL